MKLKKSLFVAASWAILQSAFIPLGARAQSSPQTTIEIVADIDGRSQLILRGNTAQWHHLEYAAPGRENGTDYPTTIDGVAWFPVWPDLPDAQNRQECFSDVFSDVVPPLPAQPTEVGLQIVSVVREDYPGEGGGPVTIVQFPAPENDFTIIVEFDDNLPSGSAFYDVKLLIQTLTMTVPIDIKPGSDPNSIDPRSRGVIPVAVLTTDTLDAAGVSPSTVKFGPNGAGPAMLPGPLEDVDGDGDLDLVLHFRTQVTGILCGDTQATLTGETSSGQDIQGTDRIVTVGCR